MMRVSEFCMLEKNVVSTVPISSTYKTFPLVF